MRRRCVFRVLAGHSLHWEICGPLHHGEEARNCSSGKIIYSWVSPAPREAIVVGANQQASGVVVVWGGGVSFRVRLRAGVSAIIRQG